MCPSHRLKASYFFSSVFVTSNCSTEINAFETFTRSCSKLPSGLAHKLKAVLFLHSKAVNKAYEEYVLATGSLDERIFLGEDAEEEVGTLSRCVSAASGTESAERTQMRDILQQHLDKVGQAKQTIAEPCVMY